MPVGRLGASECQIPNDSRKGGIDRLLALIGRPVRRSQGRDGVVIEAFRGYGSRERMFLIGRVFRQSPSDVRYGSPGVRAHLRDIGRRISRRKVADAPIEARFGSATRRTRTDRDGFFRFDIDLPEAPPADRSWHRVELLLDTAIPVRATADVYVPLDTTRLVVVSDIDDTVMYTGVGNKLAMLWRLFFAGAAGRVAFPGVAAFYRALHDGAGGSEDNPVLYVSRAPWGTYDMLTAFFRMHDIPVGPELFLREWGLSWRHPFPRKARDHKRELIGNMLALYSDLPFVLVGDSGQHDPEVYADVVREHPGRVRAVYIRNVSRRSGRASEIEELARSVAVAGSTLVLAADTVAMAEHAAGLGLVGPHAVGDVARERAAQDGERRPATVHSGPDDAAAAALATSGERGAPPNVVVGGSDGRVS